MELIKEPVKLETNNPYHVPTKKDKLLVIGSHLKARLSVKVKRMFEDKKQPPAEERKIEAPPSQPEFIPPTLDENPVQLPLLEGQNIKSSPLLGAFGLNAKRFKVAFLTKGEVLIYIALSKNRHESLTSLRKQLEVLHTQFISITTQSII